MERERAHPAGGHWSHYASLQLEDEDFHLWSFSFKPQSRSRCACMQNRCPFVKTPASGGSEATEQGVEQCCFLRGTPEVVEPFEPGEEGSGPTQGLVAACRAAGS